MNFLEVSGYHGMWDICFAKFRSSKSSLVDRAEQVSVHQQILECEPQLILGTN